MTAKKKIAILGSTGSIGTQTLDIISDYPDMFEAHLLVAGSNVDLLIEQSLKYRPAYAIIADESKYSRLQEALSPYGIKTASGTDAVADAMALPEIDTVVTATVGYSGLTPTIRAIQAGKRIALANKETLVVAGELISRLLSESVSTIIPVDSEHSAIYQCLVGEEASAIKRLIITASGGPFRNKTMDELKHVTVSDALNHPNWEMGAKITIDSATMLNKAFEIIEARWLFDIAPDRIEAVVHPQSIVHSMVEFVDGAVKAQLGTPDMHLPIRYALGETKRLPSERKELTLADYMNLTFEAPDTTRFPMLKLAYMALEHGGNVACTLNAANEIANAAFRRGQIGFLDINRVIEHTILHTDYIASPTYEDYVNTNNAARSIAEEHIKKNFI